MPGRGTTSHGHRGAVRKDHSATTETLILDGRTFPALERHPRIVELLDQQAPGEEFLLINDHEPKPLHNQVQASQPECFAWKPRENGAHEWMVRIRRRARAHRAARCICQPACRTSARCYPCRSCSAVTRRPCRCWRDAASRPRPMTLAPYATWSAMGTWTSPLSWRRWRDHLAAAWSDGDEHRHSCCDERTGDARGIVLWGCGTNCGDKTGLSTIVPGVAEAYGHTSYTMAPPSQQERRRRSCLPYPMCTRASSAPQGLPNGIKLRDDSCAAAYRMTPRRCAAVTKVTDAAH
jgi:uncharacterized protein (DUF2249 family)